MFLTYFKYFRKIIFISDTLFYMFVCIIIFKATLKKQVKTTKKMFENIFFDCKTVIENSCQTIHSILQKFLI